ncbi:MAG: alpha/beta fold hydrolase [Bdellovibrionota bacterium]
MNTKWFFLRGLVREAGHWAGFLERFEKAFPGVEAIPLEIPGNGRRFRERSPLSVPAMVEAARAEFLTRKGEKNFLFALSLGGMIGLDWMSHYPGDFAGAALVNTSVRGLSPLRHRLRPRNYGRIARMFLSSDPEFVEQSILEFTSTKHKQLLPLAAEWVKIAEAHPVSPINAMRQLLAAARFHPPKEKPAVKLLVLNGAGDQLVNPACSRALAEAWSLPLHVHPTAGHDLTLDEPEWVLAKIREFF